MQSLMEIGSGGGINTTTSTASGSSGGIFKRKKPDRTEISNSSRKNNNISGSGYEISSCSTLHKLNDDVDIGEDIGDQRYVSKLVEACCRERSSPSPEICADTDDEMEYLSTTLMKKSPTAAEIEEFFSAAEKEDQKKFMNKYNFDVVKDVPLAGRYEWVRIKPY